jgi:hypothetical protein
MGDSCCREGRTNNEEVEVIRGSAVLAGGRFGRLCPVSTVSEANGKIGASDDDVSYDEQE